MLKKILLTSGFMVFICFLIWFFIPDPGIYPRTTWSKAYKSQNGQLLRLTLSDDDKYRLFTPFDEISEHIKKASVFYEDRDFYNHPGFNLFSLFRGFLDTYILKKRSVGGSTISMQTARIRFQINSSTIKGKIIQILRAVQLERHYSKNEILCAYLNLVPYGGNIEGVGAASEIYFHKSAQNLNISEAFALCVIPQNPSKRAPLNLNGQKELERARKRILRLWNSENNKKIEKRNFIPLKFFNTSDIYFRAPHFVDFLEKQNNLPEKGTITTSLDLNLQNILDKRIKNYIEKKSSTGILNASALIINYKTSRIKAMVGSADYFSGPIHGQVNGCTSKRSPGSTLKPFVYALAIDQGLIHSHTLLKDAPASYSGFTPENYDKQFEGPVMAYDALVKSRNLPAVELALKIHAPDLYDFLKICGVKDLNDKSFYGLSLVLGGGEVTMLELGRLYMVLGNYGLLKEPVYTNDEKSDSKRVLSRDAAFIINDILSKNPKPGTILFNSKNTVPVSWKTGTSYGFRDAWAAGVFGDYVLCVWVGNFDGQGNPAFTGRQAAGPLFFDIIDFVKNLKPDMESHIDESKAFNVKKVDVCAKSGDLPGKYTPHTSKAWFIPGVSPIKVSTLHRMVFIDKKTGKRACRYNPLTTKKEIFEFWPSDMKKLFEKGGIYLKTPPPYMDECIDNNFTDAGIKPSIVSPYSGIKYVVLNKEFKKIPFKASSGPGVKNIYWFVNSAYAGSSTPDEVFMWKAKPGKYLVRACDDFGRADAVSIDVGYISN